MSMVGYASSKPTPEIIAFLFDSVDDSLSVLREEEVMTLNVALAFNLGFFRIFSPAH